MKLSYLFKIQLWIWGFVRKTDENSSKAWMFSAFSSTQTCSLPALSQSGHADPHDGNLEVELLHHAPHGAALQGKPEQQLIL